MMSIVRSLSLLVILLILQVSPSTQAGELNLAGNFTQGGLIEGQVQPGQQIFLGEREISQTIDGRFIIGFGRDAAKEQILTLINKNGSTTRWPLAIDQRAYKIERINGISKRLMSPTEEDLKRISEEAQLVAEARAQNNPTEYFRDPFIWPVQGRISGVYGSQRFFNGEPRRPHFGIDIAVPKGTPVVAPVGGQVTLAHEGMFFSGMTLIIDHGHGLSSSFLHLERILVKVGETVSQGQVIASVGASGRVTGPHLDWRVNWFEQRLDPALLVPKMTE